MLVAESCECSSCGRDNDADAIFCARCIAPLRIRKLDDMDPEDFRIAADALAKTLSPAMQNLPTETPDARTSALLDEYLNLHWLRPETALWQTLDARALNHWRRQYVRQPLLDLGCGDGTHAAVMFGTRFDAGFDVFASLRLRAADIYDAFDARSYRPRIASYGERVAFGIDIRPNMVRRAEALGTYLHTLLGDATNLPLHRDAVRTVFSNVIRDFPDQTCQVALREISRVLQPGGCLILPAPAPDWRDQLYFYPAARALNERGDHRAAARMAGLDRGRSVSFAQQKSRDAWGDCLADAGLEIIDCRPTHAPQVVRFWDVGLRPFSVPLLGWVNSLDAEARSLIKRSFIATVKPLLARLLSIVPDEGCGHVMYLARKV